MAEQQKLLVSAPASDNRQHVPDMARHLFIVRAGQIPQVGMPPLLREQAAPSHADGFRVVVLKQSDNRVALGDMPFP